MNQTDKPPVLILVGPTAVGKTAFSIACAKHYNGEILSADSMQIYRGMDIGTAKVTQEEMEGIPHYGLDLIDPDQPFTVAEFQAYADPVIRDIHARGKLPIVVGGTMLYVKSLTNHLDFTEASADFEFRARLQAVADEQGGEFLHKQLHDIDPTTAARLHPNDVKRIIRALEVYETTGKPMSQAYAEQPPEPKYDALVVGLNLTDRAVLYDRINRRVDLMLEQGLIEEVQALLAKGYSRDLQSMQGIGYKEILDYLEGRLTLEEATDAVKQGSRRYAKRQLSWWRRETDIHWFDSQETTFPTRFETIDYLRAGIS
ncbi:tRNA (adenosine(37)-N6)-dimethylallyltransferase MiaA [Tumebacillus permanentifrigoris]|uniref:tRNA dimethylallyltransferase n=1 Tax=Tumebacillus permanentifrigoris TaxID=378543 RepID=A0A316D467_9BACL|nr:tRNA (adenosine(37)-N6)-dimethylallyltransferase MiaA [Tumebacillus permanentifrigoris]PWK06599.1 tRNA dimethylallyltransferase [Tumebacillus permanentifrigoris]